MSTTLLIGRCPAAVSRAFSHSGEGAIVTSSNTRAVKRGHRSGHSTMHLGARQRRPCEPGSCAHGAARERRAGGGVQLARDAVDAEAVGAVGRDLELEHLDRDRQHLAPAACRARAPRRASSSSSTRMPAAAGADLELALGEDHAFGDHAAQLRLLQLASRRASPRPGRATATVCPAATFGAPQTIVAGARRRRRGRPCRPSAGRRRGAARRSSTRPTTKCSAARHAVVWIASTFVPVIVRRSSIARTSSGGSQYSRSHGSGHPHPNCSRKRRSFSKYSRRSGMPCLSIAIRSMPIPKAKPCTFSGS